MMKSLGLSMGFGKDGLSLSVSHPTSVDDAVWDAVEQAINAGWTPQQFRNEIADAWRDRLLSDAKDAVTVLSAK